MSKPNAPFKPSMTTLKRWTAGLAVLLAIGTAPAGAQPTSWTAGTGDWFTSGNWDNGVPTAGTLSVNITNGGTAQIATGGSATYGNNLNLGTNLGIGALEITNGSLNFPKMTLGTANVGAAGSGSLTLSGSNASATGSTHLYLGFQALGTATVDNGAILTLNSNLFTLGYLADGSGILNINATGSSRGVVATQQIKVGAGTGAINFNGGILRALASEGDFLSNFPNGNVTINAGGAFIDSNGFNIGIATGMDGAGTLTKLGTGNLYLSGANIYTGGTTVKAGTLGVTGSVTHTGANMVVGDTSGDYGVLIISNTGSVSNNFGYIASGTGSQGVVQVNNNATWTNAGELYAGYQGNGRLEINDSGAVSNTTSFIGVLAGSIGEVDVFGGTWTNTGGIIVGYQGSGSLYITGGTASSAGGYVGYAAASDNNTVEIQNTGSSWTSTSTFHLGYDGSGNTVKVYDGGKLDVQGADAIIGFNGGANDNKLTVTGTGSTFINDNTFYVGRSGTGNQLEVLDGAVVTSKNVRIGGGTGSNGTTSDNSATVDGTGSAWNISGTLRVGSNGDNTTLTVQNGGLVTVTGNSFLSYDAVSDGNKVNITGTGSTMTAAALIIGRLGTNNTVTVDSGGKLTSTAITLAEQAGSSGTLQIGNGGVAGIIDAPSINGVGGTAVVNFNHTDADYFFTNDGTSGGTGIAINGTTSVNLNGAGKTTFTGASLYTGNTAVNAGFLAVNGSLGNTAVTVASGATLGGTGTIGGSVTIESGGTIAPGNSPGILTVGSLTLNSGSTSTFEINGTTVGTQYDQIVVNGAAALDGTLNLVFGGGYVPTNGDTFTLIDATSITGDFATIVNPLGNAIVYTTTITDDYVFKINAVQTAFANFALTPNQLAMTTVLDKEFAAPGLLDLINKLNSLPGTSLPDAFDEIIPDELISMPNTTLANARALHNQLGNRFREIRSGQNFSANGLTLSDPSRMWKENPNSFLADVGQAAVPGFKMLQPAVQPDRNFGVFVSGQGVIGDFDGDNQVDGFDFTTGGMTLGMDYRVGPQTTVGVYAGYQGTDANLASGSESKSDSAKFGVYGTHDFKQGSWLTASIGGGIHSYDTERNVLGTKATGNTDGREISTQLGLGHDFKAGQFTFGPEANLAYTHLWIDGFTENGGLAPLNIRDQDANSLRSMIGGRVSYDWNWKSLDMTLRPFANIGWQHEFLDDGQSLSASFANGAGGVFNVQGASADRDSLVAGAGASLLFSEQWALNLGYAAEANSDYEIHQINGSINFSF